MRRPGYPAFGELMGDRLSLRREVFDLYGISGARGLARTMADELRASLMACIDCSAANRCKAWVKSASASDDPPGFCEAREVLLRLRAAV